MATQTAGLDDRAGAEGRLWALAFADGRADAQDRAPQWTWTHFTLGDARARGCMLRIAKLPAEAVEIMEGGDERIQIQAEGGWTFGVLPDLERDLAGQPLGAGRLFFALHGGALVTARRHALRVVDDVHRQAERGLVLEDPPAAVAALIERYAELIEARLELLADRLDAVEDRVLRESADVDGLKLGPFRREVARHRRELQALIRALVRGRHVRGAQQEGALAGRLGPLAPVVEDLDHDAAALQDRARLLHEEIDTLINGATNRSMRTLTVMSTLLIPPTLLVGAFGMNVEGVPFARSPAGFALASLLCAALVGGALVLLRRLRLLG